MHSHNAAEVIDSCDSLYQKILLTRLNSGVTWQESHERLPQREPQPHSPRHPPWIFHTVSSAHHPAAIVASVPGCRMSFDAKPYHAVELRDEIPLQQKDSVWVSSPAPVQLAFPKKSK
jgi:hypothetical protein